jgi:Glycosyl hydrolase family 1
MSIESDSDYFTDSYYDNLERIWDSLLPSPDICIIKKNGEVKKIDQTIQEIAQHYIYNIAQLAFSLLYHPFAFTFSSISSLLGRVKVKHPSHQVEHHTTKSFGFANSGFQDGAIGTSYDVSTLKGHGTGDWDKILKRAIQKVTESGEKVGAITRGITLKEGDRIEDLFVNIIDHPRSFAKLLKELGCKSYRISLERSVIEPSPGKFNDIAIGKYRMLYQALIDENIEPWVTLCHFTNPQWLEDLGGFANDKNIAGFIHYSEKMVKEFPMVKNWMTFNEPGIRSFEGYVRGEHPPEITDISTAVQVQRNLLIAHTKAYDAMKAIRDDLNVGITHQWLKFLPLGWNPLEKIIAHFYTSLAHTPIFNFFKNGVMHVKIPFKANVQLRYESETTKKIADFLGVQAYGFPRIKIGFNHGVFYPGAKDKVMNFILPWLNIGFTAGSTCEKDCSMQYFGPPSRSSDLINVLEEAFSIPKERISAIGITETGSDAKRMDFGEREIKLDNDAQAKALQDIFAITQKYPLHCLFVWTLNRHCEWISGSMPNLGLTTLKNKVDGSISYEKTPAILKVQEIFRGMQDELSSQIEGVCYNPLPGMCRATNI